MSIKDFLVALVAAAFAWYAVYKGLQIVAIFSMCVSGIAVYKFYSQRIVSLVIDKIRNTTHTKLGKFELTSDVGISDLLPLMEGRPSWAVTLISQMKPECIFRLNVNTCSGRT